MRLHSFAIFWILCLEGCVTTATVHNLSSSDKCEEALAILPGEQAEIKSREEIKATAGSVASYTASGGAFAADVILIAGKSVIYCPAAYLMAIGGVLLVEQSKACWKNSSEIFEPKVTKIVYRNTKSWREKEYREISQMFQDVASCYIRRDTRESLEVGNTLLDPIIRDRQFMSHLESTEASKLVGSWELINRRISVLNNLDKTKS